MSSHEKAQITFSLDSEDGQVIRVPVHATEELRNLRDRWAEVDEIRLDLPDWSHCTWPTNRHARADRVDLAMRLADSRKKLSESEAALATALDTIARLAGVATSHEEMRAEIVKHNREVSE